MIDNPYPGLRPFRADEAHLFFGRESQVDTMVDRLAATRMLAVVGSSGCGKSSLVNCGLRPALQRGVMATAGSSWRICTCRPGADPIGALARALAADGALFDAPVAGTAPAAVSRATLSESTLRLSRRGLVDLVEQARLPDSARLLLVVDQFEELFRYRSLAGADAAAAADAVALVNLLLEAAAQRGSPIYLVLTMRSDFLGDCTQFLGLAEAINAGQYLVPRLTRDERRAAIAGPAQVAGARISPTLLTRLVNDVGDNPDQLSILQHALNRTWAGWAAAGQRDTPLALTHYEAIGGMQHALDRHAERALAELDAAGQALAERIFRALTDRAEDPRGVRRPTRLDVLCAVTDAAPAAVEAVLAVFRKSSRSFLLPPLGVPLASDTVIDISHESLMRVWDRLKRWSENEAQSARHYRRIAQTAALEAAQHASLWRDPELQLALDWREQARPNAAWTARYAPGFDAAMDFLDRSRAERDAELARRSAQARQTQEDHLARAAAEAQASVHGAYARRMRNRFRLSVALGLAAVGLAGYAFLQSRYAHDSARLAAEAVKVAKTRQFEAETALEREGLIRQRVYGSADQQPAAAPNPGASPGAGQGTSNPVIGVGPAVARRLPTMYVQVQDASQKSWGDLLRSAGEKHNLSIPRVEVVRTGPTAPELRYFRAEDADTARAAFEWLRSTPGLVNISLKPMTGVGGYATDSPMELWYGTPRNLLVIAGSFTERERAVQRQKELQEKGFSAQIVEHSDYSTVTPGVFAVALGPYARSADAQDALRQVQAVVKDAYVKPGL